MEQLTATLRRKVGPFSVGVWLLIIVAGVGLGFLIRRRVGVSKADTSGSVEPAMIARGPIGLGLGPDTPGAIIGGSAPATISRSRSLDTVDRSVIDSIFDRFDDLQGNIREIPRKVLVSVDQPVTVPASPDADKAAEQRKIDARQAPAQTIGSGQAPTTGYVYVVKPGDNLSKVIGPKTGVPWRKIYNANRAIIGPNPALIHSGQRLIIPTN